MTPQQKEYMQDMESNVLRMRELVSKLLDVSRIEEKRLELNQKTFDLFPMAEDVVKDLTMWAKTKGSIIILNKGRGKFYIHSDPIKIRDVIENFISNAVKYNPSSKGQIEVSIEREEGFVKLRCKDNSIGVEKEDNEKVFTKFFRSDKATNLDTRGTGLGLYLSKAIIEQSGGTIGFEKNEGSGSTFYFKMPFVE